MDRKRSRDSSDAVGVNPTNGFAKALEDDNESLVLVMKKFAEFDKMFCEMMAKGSDFTLRLEIRGNAHKVLHVRAYSDNIERPKSAGNNSK